ncbi:SDR family NAD(P)-dependent oxidoreductase [Candidatus Woesearchaeota archaeon]|nr:SDR family NAD(P)-dependent oxidoreductase [Candidatus Woesearchaeota archaeon]
METILVTGGAGFIGSHVCEKLLEKNYKVICIDNFNDFYSPKVKEENLKECLKDNNFVLYREDITNFEGLKKIFQENKIDKIIHLAARAGVRFSITDPVLYEKVNIKGTINLLELAKDFKIKNFIFGSSSSIYGVNKKVPFSEDDKVENQISPYGASKRAGEMYCRVYHKLFGLKITCLRFFTVYGPRGRPDMAPYKFTKLISEGKEIKMYGDGSSKRDYTYVTDIVEGVISASEKDFDFEIINLGDSNPVELRYFISLFEKSLGKKAKIKQLPMQPGDVTVTFADISKAEKLLNYRPKVKIEEGIKLLVEWFKENN